jgi:hypothetical protein
MVFPCFSLIKKSLICGNTHGIPIQWMSLGMSRHIPGASVESVEAGGLSEKPSFHHGIFMVAHGTLW